MDEPAGFREFVVARSPALLRTAWMLTGNAATAEDLLQTSLAKTWPHWSRISEQRPEAYVRRVLVHTHATWRLRRWHAETPTADPAATAASPGDQHALTDERLALSAALASLPLRQRQAVVLRFFDDLRVEATADIMGSSPGTVKSQCSKGLAKLREALRSPELRDPLSDLDQVER